MFTASLLGVDAISRNHFAHPAQEATPHLLKVYSEIATIKLHLQAPLFFFLIRIVFFVVSHSLFFFLIFIYLFLAVSGLSGGMQDLC